MNHLVPGNGDTAPQEGDSEKQHADLLATYDEALANGSTSELSESVGLDTPDRLRFEENQKCLQLLEQDFPRNFRSLTDSEDNQAEVGLPYGQQIGRFTVLRELGRGSFGIVYLAEDPILSRHVALKVPRANVLLTAELRERFLREAQAAGRLNHPNLVRVMDAGVAGLFCYIVSDYCAGPTLAAWIKENAPCHPKMAAQIVLSIARAVAYIHSQGILHRDIKPSNILLEETTTAALDNTFPFTPRLTDFGLARVVDSDGTQTATCAILGTPAYMAPEQARGRGKELVRASDVYPLGVVLYELCTGRTPLAGSAPIEVLARLVSEELVPPRQVRRDVPRDLEAICLKCLERDPQRRYVVADALAADLERFLDGRPTVARPVPLWKRGIKHVRRRPKLAAGIGLCFLMALVMTLGSIWIWREKNEHANAMLQIEQREQQGTNKREREREYENAMRRAIRARRQERLDTMQEILASLRPASGEEDLREYVWHYLWNQRERRSHLGRHQAVVDQIVYGSKGLVTAAQDGQISHWDLHTDEFRQLALQRPTAGDMQLSVDGKRIITRSPGLAPVQLYSWNAETGKLLREVTLPWMVNVLACSRDGGLVAVGGRRPSDGMCQVLIWDSASGQTKLVWEREGHGKPDDPLCDGIATALQISPDNKRLAIAFRDNNVVQGRSNGVCQILNIETGATEARVVTGRSELLCLAFSSDGDKLATGDFAGEAKVWDTSTFQLKVLLESNLFPVRCMSFSPDGKSLACGMNWPHRELPADSDWVLIWDLATKTKKRSPHRALPVHSLAFSPDGATLAMGCGDTTVRLWNLVDPDAGYVLQAHNPAEAWGIAFDQDRPVFATCGDDHLAKIWDLRSTKELVRCEGAPNLLLAVDFAADRPLMATAGYDGIVRVWNAKTGQQIAKLEGHQGPVRSVRFSQTGELLASGSDDQTVKLWDVGRQSLLRSLEGHSKKVRQVLFPDDRSVISGGNDGLVNHWDVASGELLTTFEMKKEVWSIAQSPTEPLLAIATEELEIELLRTDSWKIAARLSGHTQGVLCVSFSPDGKTLASCGLDRSVRLWHVATGQELLSFSDLPSQMNGVAFSADGRTLAATCHDGTVRLWRAAP